MAIAKINIYSDSIGFIPFYVNVTQYKMDTDDEYTASYNLSDNDFDVGDEMFASLEEAISYLYSVKIFNKYSPTVDKYIGNTKNWKITKNMFYIQFFTNDALDIIESNMTDEAIIQFELSMNCATIEVKDNNVVLKQFL